VYLLFVPVLAYYIIFHYAPIYGLVLAFKDYLPSRGIFGSPWIGFENFQRFFSSIYFGRTLRNTVLISVYEIVFGFPAPILFALLLNEIRGTLFKRAIQTVTYLPHFISTMVICGMILDFSLRSGLFNDVVAFFGGTRTDLLMRPEMFRPIYIASGIWQGVGWGSIVYLAALTSIDQELYEAAYIDGAARFRQVIHITLPCLLPTITILFILKIGGLMSVGFEKVFLLYNPTTYEVADVISTFNYRKGLVEFDYSFSTAVGLFNSLINIFLLVTANTISRKVNETSLW
jgi:putative aldouronate transport system permease protein